MTVQYSLQEYQTLSFAGYEYKLPENVTQTIYALIKELGVNTIASGKFETKPLSFNPRSAPTVRRSKNGRKEDMDDAWNRTKEFKATKIDKKEGIDKIISDIRSCLNKISEKSYQTQLKDIQALIQSSITVEESDENVVRLANIIFDVASSNKMNSVLYANLYKELIVVFPQFQTMITPMLSQYIDELKNIKYVNHENDYDAFCDYNKVNDRRKALVIFMVNLMNIEVLSKEEIKNTILVVQEMIQDGIQQADKANEVEEFTENLYLFVTMTKGDVLANERWKTILPGVKNISGYKSKEYKSLSNRAIFKHMDIMDILAK
jgi:hypothetical protein